MAVVAVGETNMIVLRSCEGEVFEVSEAVAMESQTIKHMIEDNCTATGIPVPNVSAKALSKVIEYCRKHAEARHRLSMADGTTNAKEPVDEVTKAIEADLKTFDSEFIQIDQSALLDIILAANFLQIEGLLDLACQTVAEMIKGKTPEEIRKTLNIKNDFTPEEEEEVRRENQWALE
ncbi:hypothetical protein GUJ93_ZPchr0009g780 [Zizania palustris]|uniref:SKP1-like protein n=1 Tax=Zizania palustris TaxID=103762 RepID=A0A8J5RRT9_ZIZPA|nr:hypothetical protein GUJ93_ZPchr0009g780 [Zizania palustris]